MSPLAAEHIPIVAQLLGLLVSVLVVGWGGFRWLRTVIREELTGKVFRDTIQAESIKALHTDDGQKALVRAVSPIADAQNRAIGDIDRRLGDQGRRIGAVEQDVATMKGTFDGLRFSGLLPPNGAHGGGK